MEAIDHYDHVNEEDRALTFDIKSTGQIYDRAGGSPDNPHRHDYFTVVVCKTARGVHMIDFVKYPLGDRQVFFISPGQVHQVVEEKRPKGLVMTFSKQFLEENGIESWLVDDLHLFNDFGASPPLEPTNKEFDELYGLAKEIRSTVRSRANYKYQAVGALLKLFLIKCNNACTLDREGNTQNVQAGLTLTRDFKNLVETKYTDWHKVTQYADALFVTPDYLSSSVKDLTGKGAKEHIQDRITVEAKRLLRFSDLSNKAIAYRLGFNEPANFSAFFKNCTGISPSRFRKNP